MPKFADYVAAYDVANDRERSKVAEVLEGFGFRVQYSVFEMRLGPRQKADLEDKLKELELETGWVGIYRRQTGRPRLSFGQVPEPPVREDQFAWII